MNPKHVSTKIVCAGILGFVIVGCNDAGNSADSTGGTKVNDQGTGGKTAGTSRDSVATGGATKSSSKQATANGGSSAQSESRGSASVTGGAKAFGGSVSTGEQQETGGATSGQGGATRSTRSDKGDRGGSSNSLGAGGSRVGSTTGGTGNAAKGGDSSLGGVATGGATNGTAKAGGAAGKSSASTNANTSPNTGTCTASKAASRGATGSGPHKVTVETNSDAGIKEGTIYRPTDLGGDEKYPIFVWGEGGCSLDGSSNATAMGEIASYGYFVIADGTPGGSGSRSMDSSNPAAMGKPLLAYIDWAIAQNEKPCSAYYQSLDTTKIAANGFSCGGLMAEGTAGDARITTWGINSSGLFAANQSFYKTIHTPALIVLGGADDIAYENGERDYTNISALDIPLMLFSKALGHGGDLFGARGGDFTKIDLAWLNWWLKGDETATGKGVLVGSTCTYCKDSAWEVKSKNIE
ncbi:MAG: hypothetical protein ACM3ZE_25170 [Myxococcales bacterium]